MTTEDRRGPDAGCAEAESFRDALLRNGYHEKTAQAYSRKLREFLETRPDAPGMAADELAAAIEEHVASASDAYDTNVLAAALRRWHESLYGGRLGREQRLRSEYASSAEIDAEVARLRAALEADGLAGSTVDAHCATASMFLGWRFPDGAVDAAAITTDDAAAYLASEKPHLAATSRKTEAHRIARYLGTLEGDGPRGLPFTPACWGASSLPRMLGRDELEAIMAAGTNEPTRSRNNAALLLMANLGLRCCEAVALDLSDVDFRAAEVTVPAVKGRSERRVPLDAETGARVAEYVTGHRPRGASDGLLLGQRGRWAGGRMSAERLRSSLRLQARMAGVRDFGTHMLRRAAATGLVSTGASLKVAADILGHSEVETTAGYLRLDLDSLRQAASEWPEAGGDDE